MSELAKNALAWFLSQDETYGGRNQEQGKKYWLDVRRSCYYIFDSYGEVLHRAAEYDKYLASVGYVPMSKKEEGFMVK